MAKTETWNKTLRLALRIGLFDNGSGTPKAIELLERGGATQLVSRNECMILEVKEYLSTRRVIGQFDELNLTTPSTRLLESTSPDSGTIRLIRGIPRAQLLHKLCVENEIDPEPILEHYGLPRSFRIKPLPSRPSSTARLRFSSLGIFISRQPLEKLSAKIRDEIKKRLQSHYDEGLKDDRWGVARCRNISVHDGNIFTIEQQATFFTYKTADPEVWLGILLTDCGIPNSDPPWRPKTVSDLETEFYPLSTHGRCSFSAMRNTPKQFRHDILNFNRPDPFSDRAHNDIQVMSAAERELCLGDPMAFVADMFDTSALGWSQTLSYIRGSYESLPETPTEREPRLRADKELLDRATDYFNETLFFLNQRPSSWPEKNGTKEIVRARIRDFEALRVEATSLSQRCNESINIAMSTISILDSQKGLAEAQRIQLVTYLAFFLIPMSFIASCFGMNVKELQDPGAPLSKYFVISIPFTILMLAIPACMEFRQGILLRLKSAWRSIKRRI